MALAMGAFEDFVTAELPQRVVKYQAPSGPSNPANPSTNDKFFNTTATTLRQFTTSG